MRKIVITDEVARALDQLWQWARCEVSTAVATPVWKKIVDAVVEEPDAQPASVETPA